ncbi:hypothetical protein TL16_g12190 [Triparma laevis f. inornata]|uniref:Deoxyuridine 5'-triphosphate nucleotidohydrolase n=1 Tax=Triparma laevis f. inornata TaxID=1714386 RepID=A0A9W7BNX3_9STRA|nr:hypothetical protein TL16_g12190 [Triparma laevis f. inornata]
MYTKRFYGMKMWAILGEGGMGDVEVRSNWWTLIEQVRGSWVEFGGGNEARVEEVGEEEGVTHFERKYLKKGVKCWKVFCGRKEEHKIEQQIEIPRGGGQSNPRPSLSVVFDNDEIAEMYELRNGQHDGDSGWDLHFPNDLTIPPGETKVIDLGVKIAAYNVDSSPTSFWLIPRSSIVKTPLRMSNSVGLIDASYRGNLKVVVDNVKGEEYRIEKGERLFQVVSQDLKAFEWERVVDLEETERGEGGFGSTGN